MQTGKMRQKYEKFDLLNHNICVAIHLDCHVCLQIVSMSEVLVPVVMMFVLCIVHSHIVSTHSGPTMTYNQSRQRITRRSRHVRCRNGKSRPRPNLRKYAKVQRTFIFVIYKFLLKVFIRIQSPLKIWLRKRVQEVKKYPQQ